MIDHFCFEGDFRRECHRSGLLTLMYNFSDIILSANYRLSNYKARWRSIVWDKSETKVSVCFYGVKVLMYNFTPMLFPEVINFTLLVYMLGLHFCGELGGRH